jgi:hypothetical protein
MLSFVSVIGVADAAQVVVVEAPLDSLGQEVSMEFAANRELQRAWVDVKLTTSSIGEEPPARRVISKPVDGLYYDSARKQILYRSPTETTVCAEDAKVLWQTYLKSTGLCRLSSILEQRSMDDGFNIREQTVAKIILETQG